MRAAVITVAQQKGGAGKTTLVIQLATALRALGPQGGAGRHRPAGQPHRLDAAARAPPARRAPELRFSMIGGWRLGVELDRLKREAELIIVDTPPHTEIDAKAAIRSADLVLVPCQPSSLDIWASQATVDHAAKERRKVAMVLNRVPPRGRSIEEARGALMELGAEALGCQLGNRQAFVTSIAQGLGVVESEPRSAAADEVRALAEDVARRLG